MVQFNLPHTFRRSSYCCIPHIIVWYSLIFNQLYNIKFFVNWILALYTMSNFGQKNKFCALFLESHWFRFKMCHQCQNQGQTGLEATGGPRGASQSLQSIKIYKNQTWSEIDPTKTPPVGLGFLALSSTQSSLPFSRANWFRGHWRPWGTCTTTPKHQNWLEIELRVKIHPT